MIKREELTSTIKLFICTDRLHKSYVDRMITKLGIHRSQHIMLMYLSRQDETPSQKKIAEHMEISQAAVAVTLKKLENDGYITKTIDKGDSRFNQICITDKGRGVVEKSRSIFQKIDKAMCAELSDEELATLKNCLVKMREGLKNLDVKD